MGRIKINGMQLEAPAGAVAYKNDEPDAPARWLHDEAEAGRLLERGAPVTFTDEATPGNAAERTIYALPLTGGQVRALASCLSTLPPGAGREVPKRIRDQVLAARVELERVAGMLIEPERNAAELAALKAPRQA
jgi:hypothetical protein